MSIRQPITTDFEGQLVEDGPAGSRWLDLPRTSFRYPPGSNSYKVDPVQIDYFLDTFQPRYKIANDQTWSPNDDFGIDQYGKWYHSKVDHISLGNEPPNHDGVDANGNPKEFADETKYIEFARSVIDLYSTSPLDVTDKFWIQTGKPEVLYENSTLSESGKAIHRRYLKSAAKEVAKGNLPARIITTHKYSDDIKSDRQVFYNRLLDDYIDRFGSDVEVCFQEYRYRDDNTASERAILRLGEFLLVMSRLRFERGKVVNGGAYHQGFGAGTSNLIGLNNSTDRQWTETGITDLWQLFGTTLANGSYVESTTMGRLEQVQVELFDLDGTRYLLFSNNGEVSVPLALPNTDTKMEVIDRSRELSVVYYSGVLPARSVGRIRL